MMPPKKLLEVLEGASREFGVPAIDEEDGRVLMALAYASGAARLADLGAGVGYSTAWLAAGAGARGESVVYAVEASHRRAEYLRKVLGGVRLGGATVEVVEGEALEWLRTLPDSFLGMAFLDIEKSEYPAAVRELERVLRPGGVLAAHNALLPTPPKSFFRAIGEGPWESPVIVPTWAGILITVKKMGSQ